MLQQENPTNTIEESDRPETWAAGEYFVSARDGTRQPGGIPMFMKILREKLWGN